ncbi:MAG: hypothetical protein AABY22_21885 [Nanoarchaeota archaeon]
MNNNNIKNIKKSVYDVEKILIKLSEGITNLNHSSEIIAQNNTKLVELIAILNTKTDDKFESIQQTINQNQKLFIKWFIISFVVLGGLTGIKLFMP